MESTPLPRGYCIGCGYALQGLTAGEAGYICPECGRAFDPENAKTFSRTPHGRLVRWLATPVGWGVVWIGVAASVGVMSVSRWKLASFAPSMVDVVYYLRPSALRHRTSLETGPDYVFTLSMLVSLFASCWWLIRWRVGAAIRRRTGIEQDDQPIHIRRRHALMALALLITATGAALGWPYRLAQQWTARQLTANQVSPLTFVAVTPPTAIPPDQTQVTLRFAVIQLPRVEQRMAGLKLLMEGNPAMSLPILTEAVKLESDSELRVAELRIIGMNRNENSTGLLMQFMTHPDAATRVAAADALGILHAPGFEIPLPEVFAGSDARYPIGHTSVDLTGFIDLHADKPPQWPYTLVLREIPLNANVRDALERMMLTAISTEEREAAARAFIAWPPKQYHLRVAEWGVWLNDNGELKLVQSVLDEIPGFVHQTGNPLSQFDDRINQIMIVTKPVIHITVDRPMAVDLNLIINRGRPWFAYPKPDDFAVLVQTHYFQGSQQPPPPLAPLENLAIEKLPDVRQGYPWLEPQHPPSGPTGAGGAAASVNQLDGLGLRWQSLIVSPTRLPWMTLPDAGTDPKYAWWTRLRQVPSSWVSSRGESERFLYYDGPTLARTPMAVTLMEDKLRLTSLYGWQKSEDAPQGGLLIRHRNGALSGQAIALPANWDYTHQTFDSPLHEDDLRQDQVIETFRGMLKSAGLTAEEGEGLVASWERQFFQTDGTRLVLIMSRQDYDRLCPIEVRPQPTEMQRVGILLTEFK